MKNRFRLSILGLACFAASAAQAEDLVSLYNEAKLQDSTFLAAEQAQIAGQEARAQGRAGLLPSVGFVGNLSYNAVDSAYGAKTGPTARATIQASQPLFDRDKSLIAEQGDLSAQIADAQFEFDKQNLILRVAQAYFDVLDAQDAVELVASQKVATTQQLALAKKSFEVGTATITDTHEAQARYDLIVASEIAAQNQLAVKTNALRQLTGANPQALAPLKVDTDLSTMQPGELQLWLDRAAEHGSLLKIRKLAEAIAVRGVSRGHAAQLPTLEAVASVSRLIDYQDVQNVGNTTTANIGLQLSVPLYAGGALSSKSRESLFLRNKARFETEAARRETEQQVRQAYLGSTSGLARLKALEQALISTKSTLDSTTLGRQVGVRTNLDVLNAQQQFFSARRDLASAKYSYLIARLQLEAAAGELTVEDLQTVNRLLGQ